jgi:hypothetical protein
MRPILTFGAVLLVAVSLGTSAAPAAQGDTYKAKKAACKEQAKSMNFGVHFVKKNRWVKDCIAGKHA